MPEGPKVAIWKKKDGVGFETPGGWRVRVGGNMRQNGKDITSVTQYSLQSSPPHTDICDLWATGLRPGCVGVCAHVWWDSWGVMDRRGRGCVSGSVRVSEGGRGGATHVDGCYHARTVSSFAQR